MEKLDERPARVLTDRECAKIIGGIIGCLVTMCGAATVRKAVRWWSDTDEVWRELADQNRYKDRQ